MISTVELILASASSRRCELLNLLDIIYTAHVPNVDETATIQEHPSEYVQRIARAKANAVRRSTATHLPVLAADTVVTIDGVMIGKPKDRQSVKLSIQKLSGRKHKVLTAVSLLTKTGMYEAMSETIVKFRHISSSEVDAYSLTQEPYDKAGAYAIQGFAASFVEYFLGSYTNVIGLPLLETQILLDKASLSK